MELDLTKLPLVDINGDPKSLSELSGQPFIIYFWACVGDGGAYCSLDLPYAEKFLRLNKEFAWVPINVDVLETPSKDWRKNPYLRQAIKENRLFRSKNLRLVKHSDFRRVLGLDKVPEIFFCQKGLNIKEHYSNLQDSAFWISHGPKMYSLSDVTLPDLNKNLVRLHENKGKNMVLYFWGAEGDFGEYCSQDLPYIADFMRRNPEIKLYLINIDDALKDVDHWEKNKNLRITLRKYPLYRENCLFGNFEDLKKQFGITGVPEAQVVAPDMTIIDWKINLQGFGFWGRLGSNERISREFSGRDLVSGKTVDLGDYLGKQPILLKIWDWREKKSAMEVSKTQMTFEGIVKSNEVLVLAVDISEDQAGSEKFYKSKKVTFPVLVIDQKKMLELYGIDSVPQTIFIDEYGEIVNQIFGSFDLNELLTEDALKGPPQNIEPI